MSFICCKREQPANMCFKCDRENSCEVCVGDGGDCGKHEEWVCQDCYDPKHDPNHDDYEESDDEDEEIPILQISFTELLDDIKRMNDIEEESDEESGEEDKDDDESDDEAVFQIIATPLRFDQLPKDIQKRFIEIGLESEYESDCEESDDESDDEKQV